MKYTVTAEKMKMTLLSNLRSVKDDAWTRICTVSSDQSLSCSHEHSMVADGTSVKPVLSGHSKIDQTKALKTDGSLIQVESIAECSRGAFCNTLEMHQAKIGLKTQFLIFFELPVLKTGFTVYVLAPKTSLSPPVKVFTDRSKAALLLRINLLFMFRVCHAFLSVHGSLVVTCWEWLTSWLACMWCFIVFCHFPMWCSRSGVDGIWFIHSWSLPLTYIGLLHPSKSTITLILDARNNRYFKLNFRYWIQRMGHANGLFKLFPRCTYVWPLVPRY